jgi:hypothetical protein
MSREITEIVADLSTQTCGSAGLVPVDAMRLFRAMQRLPHAELALLVRELTGQQYVLAPAIAPASWNAAMRRGYGVLMEKALAG